MRPVKIPILRIQRDDCRRYAIYTVSFDLTAAATAHAYFKSTSVRSILLRKRFSQLLSLQQTFTLGRTQYPTARIDEAWDVVTGAPANARRAKDLEQKCSDVTPDSDHFIDSPVLASTQNKSYDVDKFPTEITAAQEAALMVLLLLQLCQRPDANLVVRVATFSRDTIDQYVQIVERLNPNDPALDQKISRNALMVAEFSRQQFDLAALKGVTTVDQLKHFRNRASSITRSNIGMSIT
jgi:hypothetical protein